MAMNSQALNTSISIFRRLRVVRDNARQTTIKHLTTPWGNQYVPAPGEETEVLEVRDATGTYAAGITDAFRYGHAVCVLPRSRLSVKKVIDNVAHTKAVRMFGNLREIQLENDTDADFYGDVRAQSPGAFATL